MRSALPLGFKVKIPSTFLLSGFQGKQRQINSVVSILPLRRIFPFTFSGRMISKLFQKPAPAKSAASAPVFTKVGTTDCKSRTTCPKARIFGPCRAFLDPPICTRLSDCGWVVADSVFGDCAQLEGFSTGQEDCGMSGGNCGQRLFSTRPSRVSTSMPPPQPVQNNGRICRCVCNGSSGTSRADDFATWSVPRTIPSNKVYSAL
jgi:hypothetical protein